MASKTLVPQEFGLAFGVLWSQKRDAVVVVVAVVRSNFGQPG